MVPLTPVEEEGLKGHGLAIGKPSLTSDCFRCGVAHAQRNVDLSKASEFLAAKGYSEEAIATVSNALPDLEEYIKSTANNLDPNREDCIR